MALPLLAVLSAAVVVAGEGIFLAPVMDGLGIAEPLQQYLLAIVLVLVSSGLLKIAFHQLRSAQVEDDDRAATGLNQSEATDHHADGDADPVTADPVSAPSAPPKQRSRYSRSFKLAGAGLLSLFAVALVFVLGWWRAEELIYAGSIDQDQLGNFLAENPTLTRAVITLLTVGLPIFAAVAFEWGFDSLHHAWQWRKARRANLRYSRQLNAAQKELEAKNQQLEHHNAALEEQRKEWEGAYYQEHELGTIVGAHKQPLWQVVLKIIAVLFIILLICYLVLDQWLAIVVPSALLRLLMYVIGFGGLYAYFALKSWDRPNPEQLHKQRRTIWRSEATPGTSGPRAVLNKPGQPSGNDAAAPHQSAAAGSHTNA
jgi:hypothetical protein